MVFNRKRQNFKNEKEVEVSNEITLSLLQLGEDEKFVFPSNFVEENNFEIIITLSKVNNNNNT